MFGNHTELTKEEMVVKTPSFLTFFLYISSSFPVLPKDKHAYGNNVTLRKGFYSNTNPSCLSNLLFFRVFM